MKIIYLHLLAKRKLLLKTIVILGLLSLISLTFLYPTQLASPHIIRKYFHNYFPIKIDEDLQEYELGGKSPDFMFSTYAENISFIDNINQICKEVSLKIYDIYQPKSLGCFGIEEVITANQTNDEWFIFGINSELYNELVKATNASLNNKPIIITEQTVPCGLYQFNSSKIGNFNLTINFNFLYSNLQRELPSFDNFLEHQPYTPINKSKMIFIPHESFQTIFEINEYKIQGYIKFTSYQEDVVYWSLDAPRKIKMFKEAFYQNLLAKESSISLGFLQVMWDKAWFAENYVIIVNIVYSFIHSLQLIIWSLASVLIFLTLIKMQQNNKNKEFQMYLAGKKFSTRLLTILSENFLIVAGASVIAYGLLWPFIKLQSLIFNFPFAFQTSNARYGLIFFPVCLFLGLLIIYLDFEFHLQRSLKNGQTESEDYHPFAKIPKYIRYQIILVFIFIVWLLNRSLMPFLYQIGFISLIGLLTVILFLIIKGIIMICMKITKKIKYKKDKPLSNFIILTELWKKPISRRFILNSLIGAIIVSLCIYSITNAEIQKTDIYVSNYYSTIRLNIELPNNNTESIESFLRNNTLLNNHYTKIIQTSNNPYENITCIHENQTITGGLYGSYCTIYGINITNYRNFYSSWPSDNWLLDNINPENLNSTNVFVAKDIAQLGYKLGDIITLSSNQNVTIAGFLDQWPGIFQYDYALVFTSKTVEDLLLETNSTSFVYDFRFNVEDKNIEQTVDYLLMHLCSVKDYFTLSYVPPEMIEGVKMIFLFPIVLILESSVFYIIAVGIYYNLANIYSNNESKTLGILFMATNFRKVLRNIKLFEIFLSTILITIVAIITPIICLTLMIGNSEYYLFTVIPSLGLSDNIILYLIAIPLFYIIIIIGQNCLEYWKYHQMQIHLLFRHNE